MDILVIGSGYVGLVTGTCLAEMGHQVTCLDIDDNKIQQLKKGKIPIYEPGLEELIKGNMHARRLHFTTDYQVAANCQVIFFAVNTPPQEDGGSDLSYLLKASEQLAPHLKGYTVLVNKSTVPCGTGQKLKARINRLLKDSPATFDVVSNPEFLKEGEAISDFMKPDRIVIGVESEQAEKLMRELYAPFSFHHEKILFMDIPSAEMTKYAANAMLATRISFMNELSRLCEKLGADISKVRQGVGSDNRIGYSFLYAGTGYGGSCFPKDLKALLATGKSLEEDCDILQAVEKVNEKQKMILVEKLTTYFQGKLKGKVFAIWGLAFKPNTDDIREAPSLRILKYLLEQGALLRVYDPIAMDKVKALFEEQEAITYCNDGLHASEGADAILLITEWKQFRSLKLEEVHKKMQGQAFFDGRNQYMPDIMSSIGFDYFCIGKVPAYAQQTLITS